MEGEKISSCRSKTPRWIDWQDVCISSIDEVYGCKRGIALIKGKRGKNKGRLLVHECEA